MKRASPSTTGALRLGLLVPCRNEAAVIARKLANLALARWPAGRHCIVVVDDQSEDGTAERARAAARALPRELEFALVRNDGRPGKASAMQRGLVELAGRCELVVLSDADVILRPDALLALTAAFERDARLGMACGAQEFVRDLCPDGRCLGADAREPRPAPGRYDRITAAIRAFESRSGRLFSVHGQLLAWRAALELEPRAGLAADDLDLMLQARRKGARVELVPAARFLEQKTPPGELRRAQELRRARAYVQALRAQPSGLAGDAAERFQWAFYRLAPLTAPWLALAGFVLLPLALGAAAGLAWGLAAAALELALLATPAGFQCARLLATIARATRMEARTSLSDRWEMAR